MTRLATIFEPRQTGVQLNAKTGRLEPVSTTYHVGHGQQLARRREAARQRELSARHAGQQDAVTRQQLRAKVRRNA